MKKAVIFGASGSLEQSIAEIRMEYDIVYATDNNKSLYGKYVCGDILVKDSRELLENNGGI